MAVGPLMSSLRDVVTRIGQPSSRAGFFSINLSSRYRWYLAPARLVIMLLAGSSCSEGAVNSVTSCSMDDSCLAAAQAFLDTSAIEVVNRMRRILARQDTV